MTDELKAEIRKILPQHQADFLVSGIEKLEAELERYKDALGAENQWMKCEHDHADAELGRLVKKAKEFVGVGAGQADEFHIVFVRGSASTPGTVYTANVFLVDQDLHDDWDTKYDADKAALSEALKDVD